LFISDNIKAICGDSTETIQKFGFDIYIKYVPKEEHQMLTELNREGFKKFTSIPPEEKSQYTFSCDFHFINGKKKMLVRHTLTPLMLTENGKIWLALCSITPSIKNKAGNLVLKKEHEQWFYTYSLTIHKWSKKESVTLTETEKDILRLSLQGYTMKDMSSILFKSLDTIKAYKKHIFKKLEVRNITEALSYAINYKLL
jgi:DNA-binding CsgD family transcriptional regulator